MCYDHALDYSDLLADMDSWGEEPPAEAVNELMWRVLKRMNTVLEEIRGEQFPAEGYWDYRSMSRKLGLKPAARSRLRSSRTGSRTGSLGE